MNAKSIPNSLAALCLLALLLAGCGGPLRAAEGQTALANLIASQSGGNIELRSFTKTDGQKANMLGEQVYIMHFQGEIVFKQTCKWMYAPNLEDNMHFQISMPQRGTLDFNNFSPGVNMNAGTVVQITGQLIFEKRESGWSLATVERQTLSVRQ